MRTITIEVKDTLADKLQKMPKEKVSALMNSMEAYIDDPRALDEIMHAIGQQAQKNGMTQEILDQILKEINDEKK